MMNSHIFTSGQSTYKVNLETGEETDLPKRYYYFLNGYGYTFGDINGKIKTVEICELKTSEVIEVEI